MAQPTYVHQEFPKVVYDPETNEPTLCNCEEDIPKGYLDSPVPEEELVTPESFTSRQMDEACSAAYDKGFEKGVASVKPAKVNKRKSSAGKSSGKKSAKAEKHTLKSLELTADDAMDLLDEEKIKFDKDISDGDLAALVGELLKDDKSE